MPETTRLPTESLLIRLADRTHNIRDLHRSPDPGRRDRFLTVLTEFYLPLAEASSTRDPSLDTA